MLRRLIIDERGQDLVEYALLTASLALISVAAWPLVVDSIGSTYRRLADRPLSLWEPPPPGSGP